jgi:hypothetical protein
VGWVVIAARVQTVRLSWTVGIVIEPVSIADSQAEFQP